MILGVGFVERPHRGPTPFPRGGQRFVERRDPLVQVR